ncbi:MAG: acetylxylan esterase [Lentisphaeria bacterium]
MRFFSLIFSILLFNIGITQADVLKSPNVVPETKVPENVVELNTDNIQIIGTSDRSPIEYSVGDPMVFTLTADIGKQKPTVDYFIDWNVSSDDGKTQRGKTKLSETPIIINTSISRPGFIHIEARLMDNSDKVVKGYGKIWGAKKERSIQYQGGMGADIDKITQSSPEPADFDAFWDRQKARLATVPLKYTMDKVFSNKNINVYAVKIDCAGPHSATGYLTLPQNPADKSLPAEVHYDGYGFHKPNAPHNGPADKIHFHVNAHGYDLDQPDEYYNKFKKAIESNGKKYALDPEQNSNPETAYFNGMVLRLMRSLQFVKQLPSWDQKTLIIIGGSQGGLQTIWAAGLDHDVSLCKPYITWCCDLAGSDIGKRLSCFRPKWAKALDYYDAVNHAKRIQCPVIITRAGLGDYTCAPSGLAALYNPHFSLIFSIFSLFYFSIL